MNNTFPKMVDILPEGESGNVRIKHITVSEADSKFTSIRALMKGPSEYVAPGQYVQLFVNGALMMSDTQMEKRSNIYAVRNATGHMLIAGLGIGMIVHAIAKKSDVRSITIIEKSPDVIKLVAPTLPKKAKVIEGDIFTWTPAKGAKYDSIYFDIWADICTDNLEDMAKLNRRFARCKVPGAWSDSWERGELLARRRRERSNDRYWGRIG